MDEKSLSHTSWNCKYHIVLVPKYRRKVIYGKLRKEIGKILRTLCDYKHVEIIEAHAMPDHVRIKEKGYIPTTKDGYVIKSGHVSIKADRYYVSVLIEIPDKRIASYSSEGIGIDLGLKDFAIVSNGKTYKNINKSAKLRKLEKKLIREQRSLSRKYENLKKGGSTQKRNIQKQRLKIQKLHHRIDNIRTDYINKTIAEIVKTKPSYITIEDLNVS